MFGRLFILTFSHDASWLVKHRRYTHDLVAGVPSVRGSAFACRFFIIHVSLTFDQVVRSQPQHARAVTSSSTNRKKEKANGYKTDV
jgi:hypothetical protein